MNRLPWERENPPTIAETRALLDMLGYPPAETPDDVATTAEEHAQQSECPDGRGVVERHDPAWAQLPNDGGALGGGGRVFVPDWSTYVLRTG